MGKCVLGKGTLLESSESFRPQAAPSPAYPPRLGWGSWVEGRPGLQQGPCPVANSQHPQGPGPLVEPSHWRKRGSRGDNIGPEGEDTVGHPLLSGCPAGQPRATRGCRASAGAAGPVSDRNCFCGSEGKDLINISYIACLNKILDILSKIKYILMPIPPVSCSIFKVWFLDDLRLCFYGAAPL